MQQKNLNLNRLLPVPSLKDMALSTIKEAILSNRLEAEVMYTEASLTSELGISRTPVREALIHLSSRGLITYFPRKGFKIKWLTENDVVDLFELRLALELAVIRHITLHLTDASLAELERVRTEYLRVMEKGDPVNSIRANWDFHLRLANLTENSYLINAIDEIRDMTDLAGARSLEVDFRNIEAVKEHERVIAEIKAKRVNGAIEQMEAHIRTTEETVLARIRISKNPAS